jgi:tetratricopeptide (TPR) repeat protein
LIFHGEPDKAIQAAENSFDESRAAMNHSNAARSMVVLSSANFYLGRYATVKEHTSFAQRMLAPMQNPRLSANLLVNAAQTEVALGQLDEGWRITGQILESGPSQSFLRVIIQVYRIRGDALAILGDVQGALAYYRQSVAIQPATYLTMDSLYRLGLMQVQQGEVEDGLASIDQAIDYCKKGGVGLFLLPAQCARAAALMQLGRLHEAVDLAEEVVVSASERGLPTARGLSYQILGQALLENGRADDAHQKGMALALQGREVGDPFLEISGLRIAWAAEQKMGQGEGRLDQRLRELLDHLDVHTRLPELRPAFDRYALSFKTMLE